MRFILDFLDSFVRVVTGVPMNTGINFESRITARTAFRENSIGVTVVIKAANITKVTVNCFHSSYSLRG